MADQVQREAKPGCFGRIDAPGSEGWNPNSHECAGGITATGKYDACIFFQSCGTLVQAKKVDAARKLIDPNSLVRANPSPVLTPAPTPVVPQPAPTAPQQLHLQPAQPNQQFVQRYAEQMLAQQNQQLQAQIAQLQAQLQAHPKPPQFTPAMHPSVASHAAMPHAMTPQMVMMPAYQQMMPVNYAMPAYLSNPEPNNPDGFWKMLGVTVFRSMGKSVGHSVAHVFDSVPLLKKDP
jgi:hypothetical protein